MTESEFAALKNRVGEDRAFILRSVLPWRVANTSAYDDSPITVRREGDINGASVNVENHYVAIIVVANNTKSTIMLPTSTSIEDAMAFADDILKRHGVVFIEADAVATAAPDAVTNTNVTPSGCCITPTDK